PSPAAGITTPEGRQGLAGPPSPPAAPHPAPASPGRAGASSPGAGPGWADRLLVLLVLGFAFLLASFPARNTDLWVHLAEGRFLLRGPLPLGNDPPFATDPRANQLWLYHLICYGVYATLGGPALVFLKALLVVGLAGVLLLLSRSGQGWWIPAAFTAL